MASLIYTGFWVKYVWDTLNVSYKVALKYWHKGTGRGPVINAPLNHGVKINLQNMRLIWKPTIIQM